MPRNPIERNRPLPRLWSLEQTWRAEYAVEFFDDSLARLFEERATMRARVDSLRDAGTPELPAWLRKLGEILERHIRREERELFPLCERKIPAPELASLGRRRAP